MPTASFSYNPVRYVKLPKRVKTEPETWSQTQVRTFLTVAVSVSTYTHARPEDLAQARDALSKIEKDL